MSRWLARLALAAAALAFVAAPLALTSSYYKFLLILVFIYAIVSIGMNVLIGYAGQFSLGHAGLMAVGAYVSALTSLALQDYPAMAWTGADVWIAMIAGTLAAGLAGAALAFPALRLKGPYLAMVTIAFGWMVWKTLLNWTTVTGGDLGVTAIPRPRLGGAVFSVTAYYYFAGVLMMLAFWLQRNIVFSDFGRKIQAIKYSDVGAASVGIRVHREKVIVFMLSAMFAGLGGALFAHLQNFINPDDFRFENSIFFLLTILFGGAGTLTGPLIGAAFLTLVPELLQDAEKFRLIIFAVLIVTTLYFLPNGVAGLFARGRKGAVVSSPSGGDPAQTPPASSRPNDGENALGGAPFMSVRSIGKAFGGVVALKDVSLDIQRGQIHALIGPNGAGKTTLVNILSGYYSPDAGGLRLGSKAARLTSLHHAARLGVVRTFQTLKLFSDLTVRENVMVGCELSSKTNLFDALLRTRRHRFELRRRQDLADAWLAFVGLTAYRDSPASVLAYGHRRWLELARALASGPQLLLLDEPAAGLVANEIEDLARIIRRIRETGVALLLIEHHMDLVGAVADYITVLDHGEVISSGTVATVLADPVVIEAYLGTPQDQDYVSAGG